MANAQNAELRNGLQSIEGNRLATKLMITPDSGRRNVPAGGLETSESAGAS